MDITAYFHGDITILKTMIFVIVFSLAVILICFVLWHMLGRNSGLKNAISAALAIFMLYGICAVVYSCFPENVSHYLKQLPLGCFTTLEEGRDVLVLNTFRELPFPALCRQVLRLLILALSINLLCNYNTPHARGFVWLLRQILGFLCAVVISCVIYLLFERISAFPMAEYVPLIMLSILCFCFCTGLLNYFLVLLLIKVNPVFIALYGFFFTRKFGKRITQAIETTGIFIGLLLILEKLGFGVLPLSPTGLGSCILITMSMFLLWLVTARKF